MLQYTTKTVNFAPFQVKQIFGLGPNLISILYDISYQNIVLSQEVWKNSKIFQVVWRYKVNSAARLFFAPIHTIQTAFSHFYGRNY